MAGFGFHRDISNDDLDIQVAGTVALTLSTTVLTLPVSAITYGGRGTVIQGSGQNLGTTVEINATSGTITLDTSELTTGLEETFQVTNSFVEVGDVVIVNVQTDNDDGEAQVGIFQVNDGNFHIILSNPHAATAAFDGSTTLNFVIIKTAT